VITWLAAFGVLLAIFGPGVIDMVATMRRQRAAGGESHREAAARYSRRGYEALSLREADEVDAAWRDSLPDVTDKLPAVRPDTAPLTLPVNRFRQRS
jgi:hypothetical protein